MRVRFSGSHAAFARKQSLFPFSAHRNSDRINSNFPAVYQAMVSAAERELELAPSSLVHFVEMAHLATQFPTAIETSANIKGIFNRLLSQRQIILKKALEFFADNQPDKKATVERLENSPVESEVDFVRVLAVLHVMKSEPDMDALLLTINEAASEESRTALTGVLKILVDEINNHLGQPKTALWPKAAAAGDFTTLFRDEKLKTLIQSSRELAKYFKFETASLSTVVPLLVAPLLLSFGLGWLGVPDSFFRYMTPFFLLWMGWCGFKTHLQYSKIYPMKLNKKVIPHRYDGLVARIIDTHDQLFRLDTLIQTAPSLGVMIDQETLTKVRTHYEAVCSLMPEIVAALERYAQDPMEGFFSWPLGWKKKYRRQKKESRYLADALWSHILELRNIKNDLAQALRRKGLPLQ